jgi:hypothetical protein
MATTTPNYGWDVPTSTDYVKDGATAIETLGDDIDASLFSITGGKGVGLQLLANSSFSAVSAVNFSNVFSSTYTQYKIILNCNASVNGALLQSRFRQNTTDFSSGYYGASGVAAYGGQFQLGTNFNNASAFDFRFVNITAYPHLVSIDLTRSATAGSFSGTFYESFNLQAGFVGVTCGTMTNFTGISFFPSSGTITGTARIYGYKESV